MKELIHQACAIGLALVFIALSVCIVVWRLENIDMTETRLFITYWKNYAIFFSLVIVLAVGYEATKGGN